MCSVCYLLSRVYTTCFFSRGTVDTNWLFSPRGIRLFFGEKHVSCEDCRGAESDIPISHIWLHHILQSVCATNTCSERERVYQIGMTGWQRLSTLWSGLILAGQMRSWRLAAPSSRLQYFTSCGAVTSELCRAQQETTPARCCSRWLDFWQKHHNRGLDWMPLNTDLTS